MKNKPLWARSLAALCLLTACALAVPSSPAQSGASTEADTTAIPADPKGPEVGLDPNVIRVLGQPAGPRQTEPVLSARAADIASKLRCPVCQGVSIADSPSGLASQMRGQVRALVEKGYSEEQTITYFEHSYGEFVRLEPPMRGLNFLLWVLPSVVLLGGGLLVFSKARSPAKALPIATVPSAENVDPELVKYLERIRRDSGNKLKQPERLQEISLAADFSWAPPLAVLALGAVAGTLVVAVRSRRNPSQPVSGLAPSEPHSSDLQRRYDALIRRLAEGVGAEERTTIELEAAQVLREMELPQKSRANEPVPVGKTEPAAPARSTPAWLGFMYGMVTMGILGGLVFLASQGSSARPEGGSPTGGNAMSASAGNAQTAESQDADISALEESVRTMPKDIAKRIELTRAYMRKRDLMKVFDQTKAILEIEPGNPHALTYQALVRVAMGQADQAETMLQQAIKKDPKIEDAYIHLAIARIQLGNRKGAEQAIEDGQKQFPEDKEQLSSVFAEISSAADDKSGPEVPPQHPDVRSSSANEPATAAGPVMVVVVDLQKGVIVPEGALLFVIVREAGFETGPPVAVKRVPATGFPITVTISEKDSMAGESLPGLVRIDARVDRDGDPMTKDPRDPIASEDNLRRGAGQTLLVLAPGKT